MRTSRLWIHCGKNFDLVTGADLTKFSDRVAMLNYVVSRKPWFIIGGPPCQAYSLAGRIRDPNNMKNDYRNYLFESYIDWLVKTEPKFFVFENVTGMLSAKPDGIQDHHER